MNTENPKEVDKIQDEKAPSEDSVKERFTQWRQSSKYFDPLLLWIIFIITVPFPFFIFLAAGVVPLFMPFALSISTVISSEVTNSERIIGLLFAILSLVPLIFSYFVIHIICLKKKTKLLIYLLSTVILLGIFMKIYSVTLITGDSQHWNLYSLAIESMRIIKLDFFVSIATYVSFGYIVTFAIRRIRKKRMLDT